MADRPTRTSSEHNSVENKSNPTTTGSKQKERVSKVEPNYDGIIHRFGSIKKRKTKQWVYEDRQLIYREVTYVPALTNFWNHLFRNVVSTCAGEPKMSRLRVSLVSTDEMAICSNGNQLFPIDSNKKALVLDTNLAKFLKFYVKSSP